MSVQIPIFSHTYASYSKLLRETLGRGQQHAAMLYSEYFRTGVMSRDVPSFTNAQGLYDEIIAATDFSLPEVTKQHEAGGTTKILLRTGDGLEVEAVVIPMQGGSTLCISSQVGCKMGCVFCETGRMGLLRNLTVSEIVAQVFIARHALGYEFRNIVFMGMGEPLDNWEAVSQAVQVLTDPSGFCFSKNRITISTSGRVDGIYQMLEAGEPYVNLAVSVNAPNDAMRNRLMPLNKRFDMAAIRTAIQDYCAQTGRQVLVAYVLMRDFNDEVLHAEEFAAWLDGLDIKVNLIPYNAQSRDRFQAPTDEGLDAFAVILRSKGLRTLVRHNKGRDIMAACGQLGNLQLRRQLAQDGRLIQLGSVE